MRRRLLDFLACPKCRGMFTLEAFKEETVRGRVPSRVGITAASNIARSGDYATCYDIDVAEGALRCSGCSANFPVINGVPRLLRPALLARMRPRYPDFFAHHPEFLPRMAIASDPLSETLESFTRQRLDLRPPSPEFAHQWYEHLRRNLGAAATVESLRGSLILDVGCGFGRHLYVANEAGAETVGIDLSGSVDVARQNNLGHPRCHIVQADILERPLREDMFDVVWSFGVLHHMSEPRVGFEAIVPFARPDGGLVAVWVYGYRGMAFTYRLSHMRPLHRVIRKMSTNARLRASKVVAAVLSALYWEPLRIIKRAGLGRVVERFPLAMYVEHGWLGRVTAAHDRLSTPVTHFHDRSELAEWFHAAQLVDVCVEDTDRRGWRAYGRRLAAAQMAQAVWG